MKILRLIVSLLVFLLASACAPPPHLTTAHGNTQAVATAKLYPIPGVQSPTLPPRPLSPTATTQAVDPTPTETPTAVPTETSTANPTIPPTPVPQQSVRFAVIGDYGWGGQEEAEVAAFVKSWEPDLILTTGDNNYPLGEAATIDENIGQYYHEYIYPYQGEYGPGAEENLFFPTLGNHDWMSSAAQPYLDYFTLPGNERYYDFIRGPVHFFALDSDSHEPDGVSRLSIQAVWLQEQLAASESPWRVVYMHHPPYSSGLHGPINWMQWPFQEWGATSVLGGHDHTYERILQDGVPFFVNGLGGGPIYYFQNVMDGSQIRYNDDYGAMLVEADERQMTFQFINRQGAIIDSYTQTR